MRSPEPIHSTIWRQTIEVALRCPEVSTTESDTSVVDDKYPEAPQGPGSRLHLDRRQDAPYTAVTRVEVAGALLMGRQLRTEAERIWGLHIVALRGSIPPYPAFRYVYGECFDIYSPDLTP